MVEAKKASVSLEAHILVMGGSLDHGVGFTTGVYEASRAAVKTPSIVIGATSGEKSSLDRHSANTSLWATAIHLSTTVLRLRSTSFRGTQRLLLRLME